MQLNIETSIEIDTPAVLVWSVLLDFDAYPEWNTFMSNIQGSIVPGERVRVSIRPPGSASVSFKPRVLSVTSGRELRWLGRFLVPGLFDGEHYFRLEPMGTDRVRFVHGEVFSGLLVRLAKDSLTTSIREGFDEMNRALKRRAESLRVAMCSGTSRNVDAKRSTQRLIAA
ncbi:SRPBCC domain-containing protein [Hydrogenophaga sp. BPS33]|uniref:SRPBCC domain-containing protein n=1 Tax=Hydrogenophaga sp. BPS33 TaxID=2651974 RepID=UPI0013200517|nr:SRPBCC domain-containing protein [Hydrogenophaga sp. BPS33]QHE85328.1 SRPBCC domain-containing protein [Hydrogenophaga sp. BPS33]